MITRADYLARRRRCNECEYLRGARNPPWPWPHCVADGQDLELSEDVMYQDPPICKFWKDLQPYDEVAETQKQNESAAAVFVTQMHPLLSRLTKEDKQKALVEMVSRWMPAAIAEIIAAMEGLL